MKVGLARYAAVLMWSSFTVLLVQQGLDSWQHNAPGFIWTLKLLPLLMFLPGLLRDNLRSVIWVCFICLGYFLILVQRLFAEPDSVLVIIGMAANVLLFIAGMMYVRWRSRELRALNED